MKRIKSDIFYNFLITIYFLLICNKTMLVYVYNVNFESSIKEFFFKTSFVLLLFSVLSLFVSLLYLSKIPKWWVLVISFVSLFTDYFMLNYKVLIDDTLFESAVETSSTEALQYLNLGFFIYILLLMMPVTWLIIKNDYKVQSFRPRAWIFLQQLSMSLGIVLLVAFVFYKDYASFFRNHRSIRHMVNPINFIYQGSAYLNSGRKSRAMKFIKISDDASLAYKERPLKIVFVLGETARGTNFSLNGYTRDTDALIAHEKNLYNFTHVKSCGTATATSVPCLFSHFNRTNYEQIRANHTENIADIFKHVGFKSSWADNNTGCKGVCDRITSLSLEKYRTKANCNGGGCFDKVLDDVLEESLDDSKPINKILYLHMLGSHGPTYYLRYPKEFEKYKPTCETSNLTNCSFEQIVNTYDNTIYYTNYVLSIMIKKLKTFKNHDVALIYISDHGESLGEHGVYLHSLPYFIAPNQQKTIPFILWTTEDFFKARPHEMANLVKRKNCKITHDNIFHSMLGLGQIKSSSKDESLDIFSSEFNCIQ